MGIQNSLCAKLDVIRRIITLFLNRRRLFKEKKSFSKKIKLKMVAGKKVRPTPNRQIPPSPEKNEESSKVTAESAGVWS